MDGVAEAVVRDWLAASGLDGERGARSGEYVVVLPGEARLRVTVSLLSGRHALTASAFVVRAPQENHEAFYRWLLVRNLRLPGVAFGVDRLGDVYLTGRLPAASLSVSAVDQLVGSVLSAVDEAFEELLALGFATAIRREWRWRRERGESAGNLAAFRHLLDPADSDRADPDRADSDRGPEGGKPSAGG